MITLRNIGPDVDLWAPERFTDSMSVQAGAQIGVAGVLADEQPADAYLIVDGDEHRAWPHSRWQLVPDPPPAQGAGSATASTGTADTAAGSPADTASTDGTQGAEDLPVPGVPVDGPAIDVDGDGVPDGTMPQIQVWVGSDPQRAAAALTAEQRKPSPRAGLITALQKLVASTAVAADAATVKGA